MTEPIKPDTSGLEQWLLTMNKQREARNRAAMEQYGMELRAKVLFASLNIELIVSLLRNMEMGRSAKDGRKRWKFNEDINFLINNKMVNKDMGVLFHHFRDIRNNFIHDIECIDVAALLKREPHLESIFLGFADELLSKVPVPLKSTESERLDLGFNYLVNAVINECARLTSERAHKLANRR